MPADMLQDDADWTEVQASDSAIDLPCGPDDLAAAATPPAAAACDVRVTHFERDEADTVFYLLRVSAAGRTYTLRRRFSHFEFLHRSIRGAARGHAFPSKLLLRATVRSLDGRCAALETYLQSVLKDPNLDAKDWVHVRWFLELDAAQSLCGAEAAAGDASAHTGAEAPAGSDSPASVADLQRERVALLEKLSVKVRRGVAQRALHGPEAPCEPSSEPGADKPAPCPPPAAPAGRAGEQAGARHAHGAGPGDRAPQPAPGRG